MGIDITRFLGDSHLVFGCPICLDVVENPVERSCGHISCGSCFRPGHCPLCRKVQSSAKPLNLTARQCYDLLQLKCIFQGCEEVLRINNHLNHEKNCPKGKCGNCDADLTSDQRTGHECIAYWKNKAIFLEGQLKEKVAATRTVPRSSYPDFDELHNLTLIKTVQPSSHAQRPIRNPQRGTRGETQAVASAHSSDTPSDGQSPSCPSSCSYCETEAED